MAESIPTLGPRIRSRYLSSALRLRVAFLAEADAAMHAAASKAFVRAHEFAECDGAVITNIANPENIPDDLTDRSSALIKRYKGKMLRNAVLLDIKSFQFFKQYRRPEGTKSWGSNMCKAFLSLTAAQAEKCQTIILVSILDPDWIAVVPRPYFTVGLMAENVRLLLGAAVTPAVAQTQRLPPELAPFIMPMSYLGQAMDNLAANAAGQNVEMRNPFTKLTYGRCATWRPNPSFFDDHLLTPDDATEFKLRAQITEAFRTCGQLSGITARTPICAPVTSDLRLDHVSGTLIFVEIKVAAVRLDYTTDGKAKLVHSATSVGSKDTKGIFTFRATWDYLFTMPEGRPSYAVMMKRDHIPEAFWHNLPANGSWLTHEYPNTVFLDNHKVRLKAGQQALVNDICNVVCLQGVPQKAKLDANEILGFAGPCPPSFITNQQEIEDDTDDDAEQFVTSAAEVDADEGVVALGDQSDEDDTESEESTEAVADDGARMISRWAGRRFLTTAPGERVSIQSRREMIRTSQLYTFLMAESRLSGHGCPIFLGAHHPNGEIGFVRYTWSEEDKAAFDARHYTPCWVGNLPNETPMITLMPQQSLWRSDYAPDEGTKGEYEGVRHAQPCLLTCNNLFKEIAHQRQHTWLLPSEYLPKVSIGELKSAASVEKKYKASLILKDKAAIEDFAVDMMELNSTLLKFLSGEETITIGQGMVEITPRTYLKTIREHRIGTDVSFNQCLKTREGRNLD